MECAFYDDPSDYEVFDCLGDMCRSCGDENSVRYMNFRNNDYQMIKCNNCDTRRYFNDKEKQGCYLQKH